MSKSILVINTPKECNECPLRHSEEDICQATWEYNGWTADIKEICPLKPMPQKNKYDVEKYATVDYENNVNLGHYLNKGWNDCIDEILGEEE